MIFTAIYLGIGLIIAIIRLDEIEKSEFEARKLFKDDDFYLEVETGNHPIAVVLEWPIVVIRWILKTRSSNKEKS